eukprot:jgi/Ulvmu1/2672/UM014_0128.1
MFLSAAPVVPALASSRVVVQRIGVRICSPIIRDRIYQSLFSSSATLSAREGVKTMASVPVVDVTQYEDQLLAKVETVKQLFADYKALPEFEVFRSPPQHYRSRCDFSIRHDDDQSYYVIYGAKEPGEKHPKRIDIEQYPIANTLINQMMPVVMKHVGTARVLKYKLFQVNFHTTLSGQAVVTMIYHKKLHEKEEEWKAKAALLRADLHKCPGAESVHIQGRSKGTNIVLDQDYVVETQQICGRTYSQKQPVGTFSQPNGEVCIHMVSWAVEQTRGSVGDALELYCGNGNFTIPMAQNFGKVVATELSKSSTAAARDNLEVNNISNVFMIRMSSEEFVDAWRTKAAKRRLKDIDWDTLDLRTLVVDPPRAGLDPETVKLMLEFDSVVYVSCNPETLHENLKAVKDTHDIKSFAVFDQFPFTHHVECGVYLTKRPQAS